MTTIVYAVALPAWPHNGLSGPSDAVRWMTSVEAR
jgi:hypothetical protein